MTSFLPAAALLLGLLASPAARADRRPPYGNDAMLLEARVREEIERRVAPLLEQMAPGQAELKYVDVRVNRPNALPAGAAPGFEELSPATEFVAEHAEVALVLDAKLPPPFRKDLKALIKNRLEGMSVPLEIKETVIPFPTPRPQPAGPREPPYAAYPPPPQQPPQPQPAVAPQPPPPPPPPAERERGPGGLSWGAVVGLAVLAALVGAGLVLLVLLLLDRRKRAAAGEVKGTDVTSAAAVAATTDHLPEVRRALREDRVLARRVISELLRENELEKVAAAVELVGAGIVEDLRSDPRYAPLLREAAALLDKAGPRTPAQTRELAAQLHRRILKQRMVGAEDPVERELGFLAGLSPQRFAAVVGPEPAAVQAAVLRYAPAHLRAAYLAERAPSERAALAAAVVGSAVPSREHLLDIAATLAARAVDQSHVDAGEAGDIELAIEMLEDRPPVEQSELLEALRRSDPAKARLVEAGLVSEATFGTVAEDLLAAATLAVPTETLVRFLRAAPETVVSRVLAVLPASVGAGVQEELSLDVAVAPQQTAEARRALFGSLRKVLHDRGLAAPTAPHGREKGKVVAL